jgi:polyhydroxyalkanoate synthesis regulator phasin
LGFGTYIDRDQPITLEFMVADTWAGDVMASADPGQDGPLAPVLQELSRIAGDVETARAAEDRETIEALRREVAELRATVARLRASRPA